MKMKKQAPMYLVKPNYSVSANGRHPSVVVMVQEVEVSPTVDGCKTFREVVSKEMHLNNGEDVYTTQVEAKAAAMAAQ